MSDEATTEATADPGDNAGAVDEGGQVDISTLPAAVQDHIHSLRDENKSRRLEVDTYKKAFEPYNDTEREYLLQQINALDGDREGAARGLFEFAKALLPEGATQEEIEEAAGAIEEGAEDEGYTEADLSRLVQAELERERSISQTHEATRALGFEPGTKEAQKLWALAIELEEPDLGKIAPLVKQYFGIEDTAPEPEAEPEVDEDRRALFPKSAVAAAGNGGTNIPAEQSTPAIKSDAMRQRILDRIKANAGE